MFLLSHFPLHVFTMLLEYLFTVCTCCLLFIRNSIGILYRILEGRSPLPVPSIECRDLRVSFDSIDVETCDVQSLHRGGTAGGEEEGESHLCISTCPIYLCLFIIFSIHLFPFLFIFYAHLSKKTY